MGPREPAGPTYLAIYLDEFQTFTTLTLTGTLAELRKYHVSLVLAHQHLATQS